MEGLQVIHSWFVSLASFVYSALFILVFIVVGTFLRYKGNEKNRKYSLRASMARMEKTLDFKHYKHYNKTFLHDRHTQVTKLTTLMVNLVVNLFFDSP